MHIKLTMVPYRDKSKNSNIPDIVPCLVLPSAVLSVHPIVQAFWMYPNAKTLVQTADQWYYVMEGFEEVEQVLAGAGGVHSAYGSIGSSAP